MSSNLVYKNPYLNCSQLVVSAMLNREGIPIVHLWKQAGLLYQETEKGVILTPYYQNLRTDIKVHNEISLFERNYLESEYLSYLEDFKNALIKDGVTVGVTCDIYELPYCIYYQKTHEIHMIEIIKFQEGAVEICDHYYHYQGWIAIEQLERAIFSVFENTVSSTCKLIYMNPEEQLSKDKIKEVDVKKVVEDYIKVMEGNPLYRFVRYEGALIGLEAIPKIKEGVLKWVEDNGERAFQIFDVYYKHLKEVGNSRYHMYRLLNYYNWDEAELFLESYQCWTVLANMICRMHVTGKTTGMKERIGYRFDRVYEQESKNLMLLQQKVLEVF
ncbi:hypothetical protein [Brevibacillus sp. SAFN-007a]|uniref:hypothetical protein n=1 Tax=Brevibacillus sp. SAFN-007a TaxID=3436862 RepID=UPI003F7E041C